MPAQSVIKNLNDVINLSSLVVKDAQGSAAQDVSLMLNILSGDPTGLALLAPVGLLGYRIRCDKAGTYKVTVTASNPTGSVTADAAGDTDGTQDTITVNLLPPASLTWIYA